MLKFSGQECRICFVDEIVNLIADLLRNIFQDAEGVVCVHL